MATRGGVSWKLGLRSTPVTTGVGSLALATGGAVRNHGNRGTGFRAIGVRACIHGNRDWGLQWGCKAGQRYEAKTVAAQSTFFLAEQLFHSWDKKTLLLWKAIGTDESQVDGMTAVHLHWFCSVVPEQKEQVVLCVRVCLQWRKTNLTNYWPLATTLLTKWQLTVIVSMSVCRLSSFPQWRWVHHLCSPTLPPAARFGRRTDIWSYWCQ